MKFDHFGKHFHPKYKFIYSFFIQPAKNPSLIMKFLGQRICCHINEDAAAGKIDTAIVLLPNTLGVESMIRRCPWWFRGAYYIAVSSSSSLCHRVSLFLCQAFAYSLRNYVPTIFDIFRSMVIFVWRFFSLPFTSFFSIRQSISEYDRKLPTRHIFLPSPGM